MKAIAVDFKDLWKIRHPIVNCEGFTLNSFDSLIEVMISSITKSVTRMQGFHRSGKILITFSSQGKRDFQPISGEKFSNERTFFKPFNLRKKSFLRL